MHVETKNLPSQLQNILKTTLEYHKKDIGLQGKETVSPMDMGGAGRKAYFAAFNLVTNECEVTWGSYGGANPFNPTNQVDLNDKAYTIPTDVIVIKGCVGNMNHASLFVHPSTLAPLLPSGPVATDRETAILYPFRAFKSGPYRQSELERLNVAKEEIDGLVTKGFLKRNAAGSVAITTAGKNASK